jgi:hypothetical protein
MDRSLLLKLKLFLISPLAVVMDEALKRRAGHARTMVVAAQHDPVNGNERTNHTRQQIGRRTEM